MTKTYGEAAYEATAGENEFSRFKKEMCIGRVLAGKHTLVIGATGSGKTFWMSAIADKYLPRFIFVNPQLEDSAASICTEHTDDQDEVSELILDGAKSIEFVPDEDVDLAIEQLAMIRLDLFNVAQELYADNKLESGAFWLDFILDEAQIYAWKGSRNDIDNFATRGRHWGIRLWALTQRPQNLSSTIINNVQYQVIFNTGSYESMYFKTYKIPIEQEKTWLKRDYHYVLYDGFEMQECTPIKAGR